jgi:hypothetical protein
MKNKGGRSLLLVWVLTRLFRFLFLFHSILVDGSERDLLLLLRVFLDGGESAQGWRHVLDGTFAILAFPFFLFFLHLPLTLTLTLPLVVLDVDPFLNLPYLLIDLLLAHITALW